MRCILLPILLLSLSIAVHGQDPLTNNGNFRIHPGASLTFFGNFKNNGAVITGATVTFASDLIHSTGSTFTAGASTLNVGGNWTNNGGVFTPGSGIVIFYGAGAQSINGTAASQTFNKVTVAKTAGTLLNVNGNTTTLATDDFTETSGNFTAPATMNIIAGPSSSLILTAGTYTAGITTNITGNWTNNGGIFTPGLYTVVFNGSGAQAINGTAASQTFYNLTLAKTVGTTLSTSGSTTTLTAQDFTETTGNFTAGTAATVNINGNLSILAGTYTPGINTNIANNFSNTGTYTAAAGKTLTFNGAGPTAITGAGTYSIFNVAMNKTAKTTVVDVQSPNFITGINTGNVYNFTFTQGTWKHNNIATLNDCHNNGVATALTIPFNTVIESNAGTLNLCKAGTNGNVILSGKLFVNGGMVKALYAQAVNAGLDFKYKVNGGTPQLYVANGGILLVGARFNANAATDYIDFNMSGVTSIIQLADIGYSLSSSFQLNNVVGGSTVMTGGTIILENACNASVADIDMGGGNISPYTVTDGTVQFGAVGIQAGATYFGIKYYTATNYPNITFQAGTAKTLVSYTSDGQTLNVISLFVNTSMIFDVTTATPDPTVVFLGTNGIFALSIAGTFTIGTGGVTFKGNVDQLITGTGIAYTFNDMTLNMTAGKTVTVGGLITTLNVNNYTQIQGNYTPPLIFNVSGNWTRDAGTFTPGLNVVNFIGTGTKIIGGILPTSFSKLTLNTPALTDVVQIVNNTTVTSILNLTKGVLDLNGKSLSVTNGLATAITRTSGYIRSEKADNSSQVIWSIGGNLGSHIYPFGTVAGSYIPFTLNLTAGNIGNVTGSTYPTASNNTPYPTVPVLVTNMYNISGSDNSSNVVDRFWQINKDGLSGTASLTFVVTPAEAGTITGLTAQRYESSTNKWQLPLSGQTSTATSATVPAVTTFSPWTLSGNGALLPIELLSFTATLNDTHVDLDWTTESEHNNDYFTIEKTLDLLNYETVVNVDGAGNSTQTLNYFDIDPNPYVGMSYYRLKQTDFDGSVSYSNIVPIEIAHLTVLDMSIFPNPATDNLNITIAGVNGKEVSVRIVDILGRECFSKTMQGESDNYTLQVDLHSDLTAGEYLVVLLTDNAYKTKKLIIE